MNDYGVPATLTVVTNKKGPGGPLLRPYPDWSWANNTNCSGITSAYAIAVRAVLFSILYIYTFISYTY